MKTKNKVLVLLGIVVLIFTGFTVTRSAQQEEKLIIGTWICKGDNNLSMKFTDKGKCYSYYTDEPTEEFNYSIHREKTPSGLIAISLNLKGITDPDFNPDYTIMAVNKNELALLTNRMQRILFIRDK